MRSTPGNSGGTPHERTPQEGGSARGDVPRPNRGIPAVSSDAWPLPDAPLTVAAARAMRVIRGALTAPGDVVVSWFAGARDAAVDRLDVYPLATLADDLRALVATVRPKGEGVVAAGAEFRNGRRSAANLLRATLVHVDNDGDKLGGGATLADAVTLLRSWGVGAVVWPSPSSTGGRDTRTWRALVHCADDAVTPSTRAGRRALVALLRDALPGASVEAGSAVDAGHLAFIHPRHEPRPASDVVHVTGDAVDLATLAAVAVEARVIAPFNATADRHNGGVYPLDAKREVFHAAGLRLNGKLAECPIAGEHSDGRGRGEDSSCVLGAVTRCSHEHRGRGPLNEAALVALALAIVRSRDPIEAERLDALLHGGDGPEHRVRARLASPAEGAMRLDAASVGELMAGVGRSLASTRALVGSAAALVSVTPGAGKTSAVAALLAACVDLSGEPSEQPAAVVLVEQRAHVSDVVRALWAHDGKGRRALPVLPVVHRSVSSVRRDDGSAECVPERERGAASALESQGANARDVLCHRGGCPYRETCAALSPVVPYGPDGAPAPHLAGDLAPRVLVATHAGATSPRAGGVLVVDEAQASPWEACDVPDESPDALASAGILARTWLRDDAAASEGRDREALGLAVSKLCEALRRDPSRLRELEISARVQWGAKCVVDLATLPQRKRLAGAAGVADDTDALTSAVAALLASWSAERGPFAVYHEKRGANGGRVRAWENGTAGVAEGAGGVLRAVRAWLAGALVVAVAEGDAVTGSRISWPARHVEVARSVFRGGGVVAQLDATGDGVVAAAMLGGGPAVQVFDARLPDRRAEVLRVVVADARGTSREQLRPAHSGAARVRWATVGALLAAVGRRVKGWREAHGGAEVIAAGLARQPIARALSALWRYLSGGDIEAAVEGACVGMRGDGMVTAATVRADLVALLADDRARDRASDLYHLAPTMRWTYPRHALARGSNDLRGCNVLVSLGDFRPVNHEAAVWSIHTKRDPLTEANRHAGAVAVQWFGRARVVREGAPVLLLHVGELPPPDWQGARVEVVASAEVNRARKRPAAEQPQAPQPALAPPVAATTPAALALASLYAAGWTPTELARRLARGLAGRSAESIGRTLRRWRDGGDAQDQALLAAVNDLAREARAPADALRARLVRLLRGRGAAEVWGGRCGAVGLQVFARRFSSPVRCDDLDAFAGGADRPEVVALLARDAYDGGGSVLAVVEAARGVAPPPPLDTTSSATERARVAAEGAVEGSEWSRGDALRLRRGVVRAVEAPAPPPPALAPPVAAEAPRRAATTHAKGAPPP